jgi:hypothetical protein
MASFKTWLKIQEKTVGSDGIRDNTPTQTAQDTQAIASKWLGNPQNSVASSNLVQLGQSNKSALVHPLMNAGAQAIKFGGGLAKGTDAPSVAGAIQTNLGLPSVIKPPKPTQVKMMRRS